MITDEMLREAAFEVDRAMLASLPEPSECHCEFSEAFKRKIRRLTWRADHYIAYRFLKQVACFLVMLLAASSLFLTLNVEARAAFQNWIRQRVESFYSYFFVGEADSSEPQSYELAWLPDGYSLATCFESESETSYFYVNDAGSIMRFTYIYGSDGHDLLTMGDSEYEYKDIKAEKLRAQVYLATADGHSNAIIWKDVRDEVVFYIIADVSEDVLIKLAQSVVPVEKN